MVGAAPQPAAPRETRDALKERLAASVEKGGLISLSGGIDLAPELVAAMSLFRAGKAEPSLRSLVDALRIALRDAARA